jgi:hypothetical protein
MNILKKCSMPVLSSQEPLFEQLSFTHNTGWCPEERNFGFFVHKESQLVRVQCKVAWLSDDGGYLIFNTSTVSAGGRGVWKKKKSGYEGRAEYFGVYSPDTGKVCMVSVSEAPRASSMRLRLQASKNNQEKNVKWAKDYEV